MKGCPIILPSPYQEDLDSFHQFTHTCLSPQEDWVLKLLSFQGLSQKEAAAVIHRSIKTVERVTTRITQKYCSFYQLSPREVTFKKIQSRAASYYYLKDLIRSRD